MSGEWILYSYLDRYFHVSNDHIMVFFPQELKDAAVNTSLEPGLGKARANKYNK